jgi:hypothetical protein
MMKLVPNWRNAWKWFSVQLVALAGTTQLAVLAFPSELKQYLPDWLTHALALVLLTAAVLGPP